VEICHYKTIYNRQQGRKMNLQAAINTMRATFFEMLLVRLFGSRREEHDLDGKATIATFRGKKYLVDYLRGFDA
jgi:hypothetical protein